MKTIAQRLLTLPKELARTSRSSFYFSFLLLPAAKRHAITTVYKFCRTIDDVVDEQAPHRDPAEALDWWRGEIDLIYSGRPRHILSLELQQVVSDFVIPRDYFLELINGAEMDLVQRRYETFDDLYPYCYRAASVVGLTCIQIFGYQNPATRSYAVELGIALQLTNILRDLKEDAHRHRIYLPREDLRKFSYTEADLLRGVYDSRFVALMQFECTRARRFFDRARATLPLEDARSLVAARAMQSIYDQLLSRIERAKYDVFSRRIEVPRAIRFAIALESWLKTVYG